jgi:16S rRNA (uracil1498-N3)-methyltransferase
MAIKTIYLPAPVLEADQIHITGDENRHLSVARVEANEAVEVFDGRGMVWSALVVAHTRRETIVRVQQMSRIPPDPIQITVGLSLIRHSAFELAVEKLVEAGVTRILPIESHRSNVTVKGRPERWQRLIVEAAKQSKRYHLPEIENPVGLEDALRVEARSRILLAERGGGALREAIQGSPALYLVGPEGGWTDQEMEQARQSGFSPVSLGTGILRTETAAIIGAALIRYELQLQ